MAIGCESVSLCCLLFVFTRQSSSVSLEQLAGWEAAADAGCSALHESEAHHHRQAVSVPCTRICSAQDVNGQQGQQQLSNATILHGSGHAPPAPPARQKCSYSYEAADGDELDAAEDAGRPVGPRAASAAAAVGAGVTAASGGGAGAKIVVRRRFARQLQPVALSVTRWVGCCTHGLQAGKPVTASDACVIQ